MCEKCKERRRSLAVLLGTVLAPLFQEAETQGFIGQFMPIAAAMSVTDPNEMTEEESNAEVKKLVGTLDAVPTKALEDARLTFAALSSIGDFVTQALGNETRARYQNGERGVLPAHIEESLAESITAEAFSEMIGAVIRSLEKSQRVPRDTRGFPVMKPSEHVS